MRAECAERKTRSCGAMSRLRSASCAALALTALALSVTACTTGPTRELTPSERAEMDRAMMMWMMGSQGLSNSMQPQGYQRQPMTYCNPQGAGMVCWSE